MKNIHIPDRYNYIACFLTLKCNFHCQYCINRVGCRRDHGQILLSGKDWVKILNRLEAREDLPITLQGGEPSLHPDFIWIINNINPRLHIDILTNLSFDINKFIKEINPSRLKRKSPYPSIRVGYHPAYLDLNDLIKKTMKLKQSGFSIGVYGILHPNLFVRKQILDAQVECRKLGIDFRTKEFLGTYKGKIYGTYKYPEAIDSRKKKECLCRTTELIIGPEAGIFKCHYDLYNNNFQVGNLLNEDYRIKDVYRACNNLGACNSCDIKIKTNRFSIYGHTSVEIKQDPSPSVKRRINKNK